MLAIEDGVALAPRLGCQVKRRPTIETVAKQAGVSRQTVSNAANAPHRLRPETLRKVLGTIDELGYRPSQAARSLRTRSTQVIGCRLLPHDHAGTGGILDRLLHALCDAARANGYNVLTFSAGSDDEEIEVFDDLLRRHTVDGFVLANTHHGDARPGWLLEQGGRFVAFGRPWGAEHSHHPWVDVDGAAGTAAAVEHLAELGHSRIGFIGFPEGSGVGDDRSRGWEQGMAGLHLPSVGLVVRGEGGLASGRALADQLLSTGDGVTALVCVSDAMAVGAMRAVEDHGGRVGVDVAVVGFDDSPAASLLRPRLTSVRQPIESVAHNLVEMLIATLARPSRRVSHLLLPPTLVVRESSGEGVASSSGQVASRKRAGGKSPQDTLPGSNRKEQTK
ncbi:MAG TPA: LacI family DNA-binding transcriptional regulator [Acidimicrobiales bacterium]|nr:LacI family DNA-binding transcriptional regulator [Acidimicrobiales bacterium]